MRGMVNLENQAQAYQSSRHGVAGRLEELAVRLENAGMTKEVALSWSETARAILNEIAPLRAANAQIENNFKYHAPKDGQPEKYNQVRNAFKELAYLIDEACPAGRERSVAMTELETANFWANASIARN